ncbi:MAG: exodeoxyribonuclease III [Eubacteriales bacterium]|nr:exodeoxyribonuclease III [Eubacteriales bacterium]
MKLISWNVNGLRACLKKGFLDFFEQADADVFCIQETKMQPGQAEVVLQGYEQYWNSALRKGYSGTAVFTRVPPLSVAYGIGKPEHDGEGRAITLEFETFYLLNLYVPNAQEKLARIDYRMQWEDDLRAYVKELRRHKPVIICGDLNVAHQEIDLKNPKSNAGSAGFSDEERGKMTELLNAGFVDTFRRQYPGVTGAYTWWSYRFNARANNAGWRIDYFLVSDCIQDAVRDSCIYADVEGSDHCPVGLHLASDAGEGSQGL